MISEARYLQLLKDEMIEESRKDILAFTKFTKPDYRINWHHRNLAAKLNDFVFGDTRFLMVFMPPRHGKSELVSRRLPAFIQGVYPDDEIFAVSYLENLATEMTTATQAVIDSPEYKLVFPNTRIYPPNSPYTKGKRNSEEHHVVGRKGKYRGQGVGGSFTGKGANWILIDDPIKGREIADSEAFRERLWEFWKNDLQSRLETDLVNGRLGKVLITLTRWHEDDLAGRLLEEEKRHEDAIKWGVISYPAIKISNDDPTDPRKLGEALWPAKYSVDELAKFKVDERAWWSLYQQDPRPKGGAKFKTDMFRVGKLPENPDWSFIMVDTAYKDKQENDYSVMSYFQVKGKELYWADIWREHINAAELEAPATNFIKRFCKYGFRGAYIEPKGHGIYLNQALPKKGLMLPTEDQLADFFKDRRIDKVERANNAIPWLVGRYVTISDQIPVVMRDIMLGEILSFPRAKHDDIVDTLIDGIKLLHGRPISICDVA